MRSAFITGAASGIGRATAELFVERGWFVGLADIDAERVDAAAQALGERAAAFHLDVRQPEQWTAAIEAFGSATDGQMDLLFNNAGLGAAGWFEDIPAEVSARMVEVNVLGTIHGVYACLPLLRATGGARLVNMSSVTSLYGVPQGAVYAATKAAVRTLSEGLALELERLGIQVSDVCPTVIDTPMIDAPAYTEGPGSLRDGLVDPPRLVAEAVWAANARVHRPVGRGARTMAWLTRLSPGLIRGLLRGGLRKRQQSLPEG